MTIKINNIDRTSDVLIDSFGIEQVLTKQVDTCDLIVRPTGWTPNVLDEIDIYDDDGVKIFGGYIIKHTQTTSSLTTEYKLKCKDYAELMDGQLVVEEFSNKTVKEIIDAIVNDYITDKSIVGLWHFNETSGTTASDESANSNDGTLTGFTDNLVSHWLMNDDADTSVVLDNKGSNNGTLSNGLNNYTSENSVDGKINKALDFDGVDDVVEIPHNASLSFSGAFSISFWAEINDKTTFQRIIGKATNWGGSNNYFVGIYNNSIYFDLFLDGSRRQSNYNISGLSSGFHHFVCLYDNSEQIIYIDGSVARSITIGSGTVMTNSSNLYFGGAITNYVFNGKIDDVRIYNKALSQSEIEVIYNEGSGTESEEMKWVSGKFDNGILFDGENDYVDCGNAIQFGSSDFSIGFWIKETNFNNNWDIICDTNRRIRIRGGSSGNRVICFINGWTYYRYSGSLNPGQWNHVVFVKRGETLIAYVNGALNNGSYSYPIPATVDAQGNMRIGGFDNFMDGKIDEVCIWNRALSAKEISEYYKKDCEHRVSRFTAGQVSCDKTIDTIKFDYETPSKCLQKLADLISYDWYVDYLKDIHFFNKEENTAPFELSDKGNKYDYRSLVVEKDGSQIKNTIFVRGGEYEGNEFTELIEADGDRRTFNLSYKYSNLSVKLDAVDQDVGIDFIDDEADHDCLYNYEQKIIRFPEASKPTAGQTLTITGNPKIPVLVKVEEASSVSEYGIREFRITDRNIKSKEEGKERAIAELEGYKNGIVEGVFTTDESGLMTGQRIHVVSSNRSIDEYFIINKINIAIRYSKSGETALKYNVSLVSTKTYDMISLLQDLISDRKIKIDKDEVLDKIYNLKETINIEESVLASPVRSTSETITIGEDVRSPFAFTWVAGEYSPVDSNDHNRPPLTDRDCLLP